MHTIDKTNVTVSDFPVGGIGYTSFADSPTLPENATDAIDATVLDSLGDFGENGFTEGRSLSQNDFRDAYGDIALTVDNNKDYTITINLIEATRGTVQKLVNGAKNVRVDGEGRVTEVTLTTESGENVPLVFDTLLSNGYRARYVYPNCKLSSYDDVPHNKAALVNYGMTFKVIPDAERVIGRVYYAAPAAATADAGGDGTGGTGDAGDGTQDGGE